MSIWKRYEGQGLPSLITTNVAARIPLFQSTAAAQLLLQVIGEVGQETRFKLFAFAIMPEHLHLVLALPEGQSMGRAMQLIKGRFSARYHRLVGGSGQVWQGRYHERVLRNERELMAAIEYVHNNPVKAGLASQVEAFSWSSAHPERGSDLSSYLDSG